MIGLRIVSFIALFLAAVFAPWPVTALMAVVLMAVFSWFWEPILIGFLLGAEYEFSNDHGFLFVFFISSFIVAFFTEECIKRFIEGKNIISYFLVAFSGGAVIALLWTIFKIIIHYV